MRLLGSGTCYDYAEVLKIAANSLAQLGEFHLSLRVSHISKVLVAAGEDKHYYPNGPSQFSLSATKRPEGCRLIDEDIDYMLKRKPDGGFIWKKKNSIIVKEINVKKPKRIR